MLQENNSVLKNISNITPNKIKSSKISQINKENVQNNQPENQKNNNIIFIQENELNCSEVSCDNISFCEDDLGCKESINDQEKGDIIYQNGEYIEVIDNKHYKIYNNQNDETLAEQTEQEDNCIVNQNTLQIMIDKEDRYKPYCFYIEERQTSVTWLMRAILIDWMMEVSMELCFKRETFHLSVTYLDRYLSLKLNIPKNILQLVGLSCLHISAKIEEVYPPKLKEFLLAANNGYTQQQIFKIEQSISKALKWKLHPITLNTWANWFIGQWDIYNEQLLQNTIKLFTVPQEFKNIQPNLYFTQANEISYQLFRNFMQLIDATTLEYETLQYNPRALIASGMYIILGLALNTLEDQEASNLYNKGFSHLFSDRKKYFNDIYQDFLSKSFGFNLMELFPTIQYIATFNILERDYDIPNAAKLNKEILDGHFEEFLAYQTYNYANIECIRKRPRNFV